MAAKHLWRNGISTIFWSYYVPEGGTVPVFSWPGATPTDPELNTLNFTYTLPAPAGEDNDSYNSKDFLIAYNKEKRTINENGTLEMTSGTGTTSNNNDINITFRHPLSAIKFMVGNISGVKARLTMVRKKKIVTYGSDGTTILSSTYGDDIIFTREVSLSGTWEPGKYYTSKEYKIYNQR